MAPTKAKRGAVIELVDVFRAKIVDVSPDSLVIEATGTEDKIDALVEMLRPYGLKETGADGPRRDGARRHRRRAAPGRAGVPTRAVGAAMASRQVGSLIQDVSQVEAASCSASYVRKSNSRNVLI